MDPRAIDNKCEIVGHADIDASQDGHVDGFSITAQGDRHAYVVRNRTMTDIVKMNVLLAGDPAKSRSMDFDRLMKACSSHCGTAVQPSLPARTTVPAVVLPLPGALVEIEIVAVG